MSLLKSRKALLGLVFAVLVVVNDLLGLKLDEETISKIANVIMIVVLAIAAEDGLKGIIKQ